MLPDEMKIQDQTVGQSLTGLDDKDVQVDGNGYSPEEGARVGESGNSSLRDAVPSVCVKRFINSVGIGAGGEKVSCREEG